MEISFEKGKFVYCPGGFNYQEVLDDFKRAKKVRIITYNISGTGNTDPLLEQIKKLGEDVDVQIITNIPSSIITPPPFRLHLYTTVSAANTTSNPKLFQKNYSTSF